MKQYLSLREQYPRFAYRGYEIEENDSCLKITYRFETLGLSERSEEHTSELQSHSESRMPSSA